jgi:GT2 family glycosyltransferase
MHSLECVLESIRFINYPRKDYEVIVVDDGSENPLQTLEHKYQEYFRLKYIRHNNNKGRAAARNTGANAATGDILIFSDGDRILSPGFFEEHKKYLSYNNVCVGKVIEIFKQPLSQNILEFVEDIINERSNILKFIFNYEYQELTFSTYDDEGKNTSFIPWITLLSGNFSIGKDTFDTVGGFDENFKSWGLENIEFGYRVFKFGKEFRYSKNAVNYHLYHDSDRNPIFMENSVSYFYQKYRDINIFKYYNFISGKIPLNAIDNSLEPIFFNRTKIGTRYKAGL